MFDLRTPNFEKALLPQCILFFCIVSCSKSLLADRVFTNGHIITMNEDMPDAETFALKVERAYIGGRLACSVNADQALSP